MQLTLVRYFFLFVFLFILLIPFVADTVVENSALFNFIANTMFSIINILPRIKQKATIGDGEEFEIKTFSSVAVHWLADEDAGFADLGMLIGKYAVVSYLLLFLQIFKSPFILFFQL